MLGFGLWGVKLKWEEMSTRSPSRWRRSSLVVLFSSCSGKLVVLSFGRQHFRWSWLSCFLAKVFLLGCYSEDFVDGFESILVDTWMLRLLLWCAFGDFVGYDLMPKRQHYLKEIIYSASTATHPMIVQNSRMMKHQKCSVWSRWRAWTLWVSRWLNA